MRCWRKPHVISALDSTQFPMRAHENEHLRLNRHKFARNHTNKSAVSIRPHFHSVQREHPNRTVVHDSALVSRCRRINNSRCTPSQVASFQIQTIVQTSKLDNNRTQLGAAKNNSRTRPSAHLRSSYTKQATAAATSTYRYL